MRSKKARTEAAMLAFANLVNKLNAIHGDPAYLAAWTLNQIHGGPYSGPNYEKEYREAREALTALEGGE